MKAAKSFYSVAILPPETNIWTVSRIFDRKAAAVRWAKWCAERWDTRLYLGRCGEQFLADYPKTA